ncbi:MAG: hypothetical protein K0S47_1616 [Herbinix sp.]|jgi:chemotaxis protein CheX|nr:hypothetical protein [Herbinix sp.]
MAGMNVEHINPFLLASTKILKDMCYVEAKVGKPYIKELEFNNDSLIIMIGVTGEMKGQVIIAFENRVACDIASKMCMMSVTQMDELAMSAIGELGNMILGNTATIFSTKGIEIDITPPTIGTGTMTFKHKYAQNICIPLDYEDDKRIEINISIKGD